MDFVLNLDWKSPTLVPPLVLQAFYLLSLERKMTFPRSLPTKILKEVFMVLLLLLFATCKVFLCLLWLGQLRESLKKQPKFILLICVLL